MNPYAYCVQNPVNLVDPTGMAVDSPPNDYIFNEKGDFVRIDENNKPDRLIIENSKTCARSTYLFADPVHDTKSISSGLINKIVFVSKDDVIAMIEKQGGFDDRNGGLDTFYEESKGGIGSNFDYTYSVLMFKYAEYGTGAHPDDKWSGSKMLFVAEGDTYAHNRSNFGNFLWSATGYALGYSKGMLKKAAQANSLLGFFNGYGSQFDSADDQLSIDRGQNYSKQNDFRSRVVRHEFVRTRPIIFIP